MDNAFLDVLASPDIPDGMAYGSLSAELAREGKTNLVERTAIAWDDLSARRNDTAVLDALDAVEAYTA